MSNAKKPIDWQRLLLLTGNKPKIAMELLQMFAAELPDMRSAINAAHKQKNYDLLHEWIHQLHGSCCYTGATRLKALAADLENALHFRHYDAVNDMMKKLNHEITAALRYIDNQNDRHE